MLPKTCENPANFFRSTHKKQNNMSPQRDTSGRINPKVTFQKWRAVIFSPWRSRNALICKWTKLLHLIFDSAETQNPHSPHFRCDVIKSREGSRRVCRGSGVRSLYVAARVQLASVRFAFQCFLINSDVGVCVRSRLRKCFVRVRRKTDFFHMGNIMGWHLVDVFL